MQAVRDLGSDERPSIIAATLLVVLVLAVGAAVAALVLLAAVA
jgi:hypothetical protein